MIPPTTMRREPFAARGDREGVADVRVSVVSSADELLGIAADWDALADRTGDTNPFTSFAWTYGCAVAGPPEAKPHVLVARRDGDLAGVAPLQIRIARRGPLSNRRIEFIGGPLGDYNDLLLGPEPERVVNAMLAALAADRDRWDVIDLRDLRDGTAALALLDSAMARHGLRGARRPDERCPFVTLRSDFAGLLEGRSPATRDTFRNQEARLRRLGVRTRVTDEPHRESALLDRMIALEDRKRIGGRREGQVIGPHAQLFRSLFERLGPRGRLYAALMEDGDRLVAYQLGFRCGKSLWDYTTAFDASVARLSPGTMLLPAVIDHGFARGLAEYDFLRGEEPYKMRWATGVHENSRLVIWSSRPRSRLAARLALSR